MSQSFCRTCGTAKTPGVGCPSCTGADQAPLPVVEKPRNTLSDGTQVYPDHRNIRPESGQQQGYVVLAEEERAKGFVRPVRRTYTHLECGGDTTMAQTIAETYARDPKFYSGTFCCGCGTHFPLAEFVWKDTQEVVGS